MIEYDRWPTLEQVAETLDESAVADLARSALVAARALAPEIPGALAIDLEWITTRLDLEPSLRTEARVLLAGRQTN